MNAARVIETDLGDELVLLNVATRGMFTLNASGRCIWRGYGAGGFDRAVADLEAGFEVTPEQARRDALTLLRELHAQGLIEQPPMPDD